jgi:hypothetical protein
MMTQKKFKDFRDIAPVVKTYTVESHKVEVKKALDRYMVYIDDSLVESFNTLVAAEEAAADAVDSLGNEEQ